MRALHHLIHSPGHCDLCCIKLENLSVQFGKKKVLDAIDLHLHCGELTALIGPNGAGKTTLFKAILGEIPYSGTLTFVDANNNKTASPRMGLVPQKVHFDPDTPTTVLDLCLAHLGPAPIWLTHSSRAQTLACELLSRVKALHLIHHRLGTLSGGELQRVLLALAIYPVPNVLLLDEPVTGVDQDGMALFYSIVSELRHSLDLSIVLITHDLPLVSKYADRIVILDHHIRYNGPFDELIQNPSVVHALGPHWTRSLLSSSEGRSP